MVSRVLILVFAATFAYAAGHEPIGTWKLDTSKSKYSRLLKPKEMVVTYTPAGTGWQYSAKGIRGDGQTAESSFTYVKDGEEIKTTGFPYWDAIILKNATSDVSTAILKRDGKEVGTVKRSFSGDGKTMTVSGEVLMQDGKKGKYTAVYIRQ